MSENDIMCFPKYLSLGAVGGPRFLTDVITTTDGREQRNINWLKPRNYYEISPSINCQEDLDTVIAFFRIHKGKALAFRFKDWTDYRVTDQILNKQSLSNNRYQLVKEYSNFNFTDVRIITKPVINTVCITIDDKPVQFDCDYASGIVTIKNEVFKNSIIKATFCFDTWVRFDTDELKLGTFADFDMSRVHIPLVEIFK